MLLFIKEAFETLNDKVLETKESVNVDTENLPRKEARSFETNIEKNERKKSGLCPVQLLFCVTGYFF